MAPLEILSEEHSVPATPIFHSQTFPRPPRVEIWRDNLLDAISTIFAGDVDAVFLEGPPGIGQSVISSQFVRKLGKRAICLFIRNASRLSYDPQVLRLDLCQQISLCCDDRELPDPLSINEGDLQIALFRLHRQVTRSRQDFYFIVDGLDNIPSAEHETRAAIVDLLPFGFSGFKFLLSGSPESLSTAALQSIEYKTFFLPAFTLDETIKYFGDSKLTRESLAEIYKVSKGVPGHLASIQRLLTSSEDPGRLIEGLPASLHALYDLEWRPMLNASERERKIASILAHDRRPHTVDTLALLLQISAANVKDDVRSLSFIKIQEDDHQLQYVSESFRRFAAAKLITERPAVTNLVIDALLSEPQSRSALLYLPSYLHEAGRFAELVEYLSPENIGRMVEFAGSWRPVQQQATLGIAAARRLKRDSDLIRLGIQEASIVDFERTATWREEVEAKMALGLDNAALAIAQSTLAREDRLHLLATICRVKKQQKHTIEAELDEQIRQLYNSIDKDQLGAKGLEIAADLVYSHPDLAIALVEDSTSGERAQNVTDISLLRFSINLFGAATAEQGGKQDALAALRKQIENPKLKRFSATLSLLFGNYSADEVIAEVSSMGSAERQISLLRQWCEDNNEREDALKVVGYALDLVVKSTKFSPNARVYREIATPLPKAKDYKEAKLLVSRFNSQKATTLRLGPTVEHVRLEMLLAETEWNCDREMSKSRLSEAYLYISDLAELSVKTRCLAELYVTIRRIDSDRECDTDLKLHISTKADLEKGLHELLSKTARQFQAIEPVLTALSKSDIDWAVGLAQQLNTRKRCDKALSAIIEAVCAVDLEPDAAKNLLALVDKVHDSDIRDESLLQIIFALAQNIESALPSKQLLLDLIGRSRRVEYAKERCRAYCLLIGILENVDDTETWIRELYADLETAWRAIDISWIKVSTAYQIVTALAEHSKEKAKEFLDKAESVQIDLRMNNRATATTFLLSVQLVIRAFAGLLLERVDSDLDRERLLQLVGNIPSAGVRAQMLGEVALAYHFNNRSDDAKKIVSEFIRPLVSQIDKEDNDFRAYTIAMCAPALYFAHPITAQDLFSGLTTQQRDKALVNVCQTIIERVSPTEPFEATPQHDYQLDFEELRDAVDLLEQMVDESQIALIIDRIADTIVADRRHHRLSQQQIGDLVTRLKDIAHTKFQQPGYIAHEGYVIMAEAQIARIEQQKWPVWESLISRTEALPSLADMAFVLPAIASLIPGRYSQQRADLLEKAKKTIEQIPADVDRVERLENLAREAALVDGKFARECLKAGITQSLSTTDEEVQGSQRRMIDLAHQMDPDFAASLASMSDTDPAKRSGEAVTDRIAVLNARKDLRDATEIDYDPKTIDRYAAAASSLVAQLNAGTIPPLGLDEMRRHIEIASQAPLHRSYPIISWVIANIVHKYRRSNHAGKFIRPVFEAGVLAAELTLRVATQSLTKFRKTTGLESLRVRAGSVVIKPGQRDKAFQLILRWIEEHVAGYLKICDPYFGPEDLEILKLLQAGGKHVPVEVLTSRSHAEQKCAGKPCEEVFRDAWRLQISRADPGDVTIIIVGSTQNGHSPIHDRWLLSDRSGLRIGTSLNSLGVTKESEISELESSVAGQLERELDLYLERRTREFKGQRLIYSIFSL